MFKESSFNFWNKSKLLTYSHKKEIQYNVEPHVMKDLISVCTATFSINTSCVLLKRKGFVSSSSWKKVVFEEGNRLHGRFSVKSLGQGTEVLCTTFSLQQLYFWCLSQPCGLSTCRPYAWHNKQQQYQIRIFEFKEAFFFERLWEKVMKVTYWTALIYLVWSRTM